MPSPNSNLRPQGAWEVKRHFRLPESIHGEDAERICEQIRRLPGVRGAHADLHRRRLILVYDVTKQDYRHILDALATAGVPMADNWWSRFKANWLQNLDETGRENANAPEAPCCSNPKGLGGSRKV
jgi:hypothetical protein